MNQEIANILNNNKSKEEQLKALTKIENDIYFAKEVVNGIYTYCPECNDFYLTKSFFYENTSGEEKVCIHEDPINSGGNEYATKFVRIKYRVCPKGHKKRVES